MSRSLTNRSSDEAPRGNHFLKLVARDPTYMQTFALGRGYVVFYRIRLENVEIVRILHGDRDVQTTFLP